MAQGGNCTLSVKVSAKSVSCVIGVEKTFVVVLSIKHVWKEGGQRSHPNLEKRRWWLCPLVQPLQLKFTVASSCHTFNII